MKKKLPVIITILILASCSTSSDVVQNGRISKRKYNKGIFHHKKLFFFQFNFFLKIDRIK